MTLPTIHSNGTAASDLYEQQTAAIEAAREALAKLQESEPNGRDYYPQGPETIFKALAEHRERLKLLARLIAELEEIQSHISFFVL